MFPASDHPTGGFDAFLKYLFSNVFHIENGSDFQLISKVHLPSTSLAALTQLQESLKSPSGLLLDIADCRDLAKPKTSTGREHVETIYLKLVLGCFRMFQEMLDWPR